MYQMDYNFLILGVVKRFWNTILKIYSHVILNLLSTKLSRISGALGHRSWFMISVLIGAVFQSAWFQKKRCKCFEKKALFRLGRLPVVIQPVYFCLANLSKWLDFQQGITRLFSIYGFFLLNCRRYLHNRPWTSHYGAYYKICFIY